MSGDGTSDDGWAPVAGTSTFLDAPPARTVTGLWEDIPDGAPDPLVAAVMAVAALGSEPAAPPGQSDGPARPRLPHQPALDGLRGLAVAAVVLYHGAAADRIDWLAPWTRGGYLGVSAFFTLSGFLICSLLLAERAGHDTIALGAFWQRRARRLLPAVLLLLAAVTVLTPLVGTEAQLADLPGDVWASLAYVANWRFILEGADYAAQFSGAPSPLKHLWSLSVEEQWYLVVPLGALAVVWFRRHAGGRVDRRALTRALTVVAAAGTLWLLWESGGRWSNRAYMGTDTRLAEMAVGALAATLLGAGLALPGARRRLVGRLAPLALGAVLAAWALVPIESPWLFRGGFTLHAAAVAVVIVAAVQPATVVRRVLSAGWLRRLGRVSYGVYLFHWPILWWVTPQRLGIGGTAAFGVQVLLTLIVSVASFRLIERPIRHGGALPGRWGLLAVVATGTAIAVGAALLPEADRTQLLALGSTPELVVPTSSSPPTTVTDGTPGDAAPASSPGTTLPTPPLRVMVVGDSFAESVVFGLQRWGAQSGAAAVMNATVVGCPFGRGGRNKGISINRKPPPECDERDARLTDAISGFDPDVVLLAGGLWDVTERRPPGFGSWTRVGDPDYDWYLTGEVSHLVDLAGGGGAKVVWANSPHWDPVPGSVIFMGPPPYVESHRERVDRFNEIVASVVDPRPEAEVLDLAGWMRAQPGGELDPSLRFDGVHFTEAGSDRLAAWLGPELLARAGR